MKILIGIDPDVDKSGVAVKIDGSISTTLLRFFELFDFLKKAKDKGEVFVVLEAGFLNKGNWHTKKNGSAALNAYIGSQTGRNHETAHKLEEMLQYLEIKYRLVRPTKSKKGVRFFRMATGIQKKVTQDEIDAAMLIV